MAVIDGGLILVLESMVTIGADVVCTTGRGGNSAFCVVSAISVTTNM